MENNYVIAFILMAYFLCTRSVAIQCSRGERVDTLREGADVCVPCEHYTFIAEDNHSHRTCKPCTFIEDPDVEVFVSFCNRTHDSVILCTSGFYRRKARNYQQADRCEKCTECESPTRACGGYYDTVCCHPNQEAVLSSGDVYVCRDIPIVCGPGQFFSTYTEECLTCPAGTFMSAHNHTYKECLKCEQLSENNANHAVITRPCNRTAPPLFGCKDGYFRDPTQECLQTEVPCTPCQSCQLNLAECDMFHDAVCDSKEEDRMNASKCSECEQENKTTPKENITITWNITQNVVGNITQSHQEITNLGFEIILAILLLAFVLLSYMFIVIIYTKLNFKKYDIDDDNNPPSCCYVLIRYINKRFYKINVAVVVLAICLVFSIICNVVDPLRIAGSVIIRFTIVFVTVCVVLVVIHFCVYNKRRRDSINKKTGVSNKKRTGVSNKERRRRVLSAEMTTVILLKQNPLAGNNNVGTVDVSRE